LRRSGIWDASAGAMSDEPPGACNQGSNISKLFGSEQERAPICARCMGSGLHWSTQRESDALPDLASKTITEHEAHERCIFPDAEA